MDTRVLENEAVLAVVEHFLGLVPTLRWGMVCRNAWSEATRRRVLAWLAHCGIPLPADVPLGIGRLARLLFAMAISPFRRFDDPSLDGELRVAVRYAQLEPQSAWTYFRSGARVTPEQLDNVFPNRLFDVAMPFLQEHCHCFFVARNTTRHYNDHGAYIQGAHLEIIALQCVMMGFELALQQKQRRLAKSEAGESESFQAQFNEAEQQRRVLQVELAKFLGGHGWYLSRES
eukprot:s5992_g1.t1